MRKNHMNKLMVSAVYRTVWFIAVVMCFAACFCDDSKIYVRNMVNIDCAVLIAIIVTKPTPLFE